MADELKNQQEAAKAAKAAAEAAKAQEQAAESTAKFLKDMSENSEELGQNFRGIADFLAQAAKSSGELKSENKAAESLTRKLASSADDLVKFTKENLKDSKLTEKVASRKAKVDSIIQALKSKQAVLQKRLVTATEEEQEQLLKSLETIQASVDNAEELVGQFDKLKEKNKELNDSMGWMKNMAELIGDVPVLGKLFKEFEQGAQKARDAGVEGQKAYLAGAEAFAKSGGKLLLALAGVSFFKGLKDGDQNITDLSRNLNISRERANELNKEFNYLGATTKSLTGKQFREATMALTEEMGVVADLSFGTAKSFGVMTKKLGLSVEQASKLTKLSATFGDTQGKTTSAITGQVLALNAVEGSAVRYQDVLKDITEASAAQTLTISKQPGGLAKAAFQARKLGMSFAQLESSANNLLDFENSISAELEAELLTGKQLNLEQARLAALRGDDAMLARELAKNMGTAEEFSKMGRLQQEKMAAAMGMTKDEVAEVLMNQEALTAFGAQNVSDMQEKAKAEMESIKALRQQGRFEEAATKEKALYNKLGDTEFKRQLENKSLMEAQKEAMEQLAEAAQSFATILQPLTSLMVTLSEAGSNALGFITKIGSKIKTIGKIIGANLLDPALKSFNSFKSIFKVLSGAGLKAASKGGIKMILKKIPILGVLVGAYYGVKRMMQGDILGGIMELGSGVLSLFPGLGTAASVAVDAALLGMDAGGITGDNSRRVKEKRESQDKKVAEDFISRPGMPIQKFRKDDIIIGATNPFGGDSRSTERIEKLLMTIADGVKAGGVINIDGSKVGEALVMGNYKTS